MSRISVARRLAPAGMAMVLGCGAGVREAAHFDGSGGSAIAGALEVSEAPWLPTDHEELGRIASYCRLVQNPTKIDGEYLSDVDCSVGRIVAALKELAASVGGTVLVGRKCGSRVTDRGAVKRTRIRCRARVARPTSDATWRGVASDAFDPTADPGAPPASDAWNIEVRFTPAGHAASRPPRRTDSVAEVATIPLSHVELGDVVTRCKRGCSRAATREGVRVVAGRMGASSVVGIECARSHRGWLCTGTAAAYEVDPDTDPHAR